MPTAYYSSVCARYPILAEKACKHTLEAETVLYKAYAVFRKGALEVMESYVKIMSQILLCDGPAITERAFAFVV